jgi:hypothetical protein
MHAIYSLFVFSYPVTGLQKSVATRPYCPQQSPMSEPRKSLLLDAKMARRVASGPCAAYTLDEKRLANFSSEWNLKWAPSFSPEKYFFRSMSIFTLLLRLPGTTGKEA